MMSDGIVRRIASRGVTAVLVVCCLATTGMVARREFFTAAPNVGALWTEQEDWRDYAAEGHRIGPETASVVMVEFGDFQCPACANLESVLRESRKRFPRDFALVYRHYPLASHRFAREAAIASECAARQERFEAMHASLFDNVDSIGQVTWTRFGEIAGVRDAPAFATCLKDSTVAAVVERDRSAGSKLGVTGTPTVLLNGKRWKGSMSQEMLDSAIRVALKEKSTERSK